MLGIGVAALIWSATFENGFPAGLQFASCTFDAGSVKAGRPLRHNFSFTNSGATTVEISSLRASCGCLAPRLEKRSYPPGEHGDIAVEVHTLSQASGPNTWTVTVEYLESGQGRKQTLQLTADIVA